MSGPGQRASGEDLAPVYSLIVEGEELKGDITQYVRSVEFESALDMADMLTIEVNNPKFALSDGSAEHPDWTAHKAFQPGNEVALYGGYGQADTFIGRAIITKHLPVFPDEGMPTLTIKGYDKSHLMMDASGPVQATKENKVKLRTPRPAGDKDDQGTVYIDMTASQVVSIIADKYGLLKNIEPTTRPLRAAVGDGIVQKKGMKDYELVRILANLNLREFWVDYDPARRGWVLNWVTSAERSTPQLAFRYNAGDASTLLSFECEYGLRENLSEIVVLAWDAKQQRWLSILIVEDVEGVDPRWRVGGGRMERAKVTNVKKTTDDPYTEMFTPAKKAHAATPESMKTKVAKEHAAATRGTEIESALESATEFRLSAGGASIDVRTERPFKSLQDAADFATRWFKARKDHFLVGKGKIVGVESLRARQVHLLDGLGPRLSGAYYFINARHRWDADEGYGCEFTARKVIS